MVRPTALDDDGQMSSKLTVANPYAVPAGLLVAAVLGTIHAAFSLYWSTGGEWLAWSLGSSLRASFRGSEWVLAPVGLAKLAASLVPVALARWGWPGRRVTRLTCWSLALTLIAWGGANTVVGNFVLAGVIRSPGYDRPGMVGHAWLWDPLFLAWGVSLAVGLRQAVRPRVDRDRVSTRVRW